MLEINFFVVNMINLMNAMLEVVTVNSDDLSL